MHLRRAAFKPLLPASHGSERPCCLSSLLLSRAPVKPLACKEEREAALICYRGARGGAPGDVVLQCQKVADELDKCAALVREAAMSKIVSGALKS